MVLTQPVSKAAWRICTKKVRLRPKYLISCNVPFWFWPKLLISCNVPPNVPKYVPNVPKCSRAGEHYREVPSIAKAVRILKFRVSEDWYISQMLKYCYVVVVVNCNVPKVKYRRDTFSNSPVSPLYSLVAPHQHHFQNLALQFLQNGNITTLQ